LIQYYKNFISKQNMMQLDSFLNQQNKFKELGKRIIQQGYNTDDIVLRID